MSDSVDRVFSHAISTVNKIPIGAEKPPAKTVLRLYGLYKQSMEGDVDGLMVRPLGNTNAAIQAREKWDAWKSCAGLSRTEAKRRYITSLISSMRQYASSSPDSRALVDELEFVWDQVKSNVSSSTSSSPTHPRSGIGMDSIDKMGLSRSHFSDPMRGEISQSQSSDPRAKSLPTRSGKGTRFAPIATITQATTGAQLRHLTGSPLSHSAADEDSSDDDGDAEEFVDAPDSQIAEPPPRFDSPTESRQGHTKDAMDLLSAETDKAASNTNTDATRARPSLSNDADTKKWRRRVSTALIKLTAEVAAMREQLEARRIWNVRSRNFTTNSFLKAAWSTGTWLLKHIAVDLVFFFFVLVWLRRKKDGRLEGAVRVLLGDAVAQVQKVGSGVQREVIKGVGKALVVAGAGPRKGGVTLSGSGN